MRFFVRLLVLHTILLYTSCAESNDQHSGDPVAIAQLKTDSTKIADSLSALQPDTLYSEPLPKILSYWETEMQNSGVNFRISKFRAETAQPSHMREVGDWDGTVQPEYVTSPDMHYYSYHVPGWNGEEPDTYLYLIDRWSKKVFQLDVLGPDYTYDSTGWEDGYHLIATGYTAEKAEEKFPGKYIAQAFYQVFQLNTGYVEFHESLNYFPRPCGQCGPSASR